MSITREVREDQHGTTTGYAYGCRCDRCRTSQRERRADYDPSDHVLAENLDRVFDALEHEADMDGLVTVGAIRLAELSGVSHATAHSAIYQLARSGRIEIQGRTETRGGALVIQINEVES